MPGASRARGLVCGMKKAYERSHHRFNRNVPAFPAQWFYGFLRALPGVHDVLSHRHPLITACLARADIANQRV